MEAQLGLGTLQYEIRAWGGPIPFLHGWTLDRRSMINTVDKHKLLESFASVADFLERGIGYAIRYNGETVAGAALALECLRRDIAPQWLAENETSSRIAAKLGYKRCDAYETFEISKG